MPRRLSYENIMIDEVRLATNKEIRETYNKLIKTANERIRVTAKKEYKQRAQAYKHIVEPLKGAGFTKVNKRGEVVFKAIPKTAKRSEMTKALREVQRFIRAKTSTVSGIREVEKERISEIQKEIPGISNNEAKDVLIWLGSEEGKTAKEHFDSDEVRTVMSLAKKTDSKTPLQKQWEEFKKQRETNKKSLADWKRELEKKREEIGESF